MANVKFGRMTRQWEMDGKTRLLEHWEKMGGKILPEERIRLQQGPTEEDLVVSGLCDSVQDAVNQTLKCLKELELLHEPSVTLREAAFVVALGKVRKIYKCAGLTLF